MDEFTGLSKILDDIRNTSKSILTNGFEIMKSLSDEECELVDSFLEKLEDVKTTLPTREEALGLLQEQSVGLLGDAEVVNDEIDSFISRSDKGFTIEAEKCPYLSEVWNGDMYDKFEMEGLQELLNELKSLSNNANREYLVQIAIESHMEAC
jgi:hypothetical protein